VSAIPENTLGGHIKAKTMITDHAEKLARALFDGKRELPINGKLVVSPSYDAMTAHEKTIVRGLFLKAEVKERKG
jgi:hypothetical protein